MADRLELARVFEDAGMPRDKAEHVASVILEAIRDNVATKADLNNTADAVKADLLGTGAVLRNDLNSATASLPNDLASGKRDLDSAVTTLRTEMHDLEQRLKLRSKRSNGGSTTW